MHTPLRILNFGDPTHTKDGSKQLHETNQALQMIPSNFSAKTINLNLKNFRATGIWIRLKFSVFYLTLKSWGFSVLDLWHQISKSQSPGINTRNTRNNYCIIKYVKNSGLTCLENRCCHEDASDYGNRCKDGNSHNSSHHDSSNTKMS